MTGVVLSDKRITMDNLVSLVNISKSFGNRDLFTDLSLTINKGEKISIIGKNGTGKSTLLKLISEIESPDQGQVVFKKNTVVAYLPQTLSFNDDHTVYAAVKEKANSKTLNQDELELEVQKALSNCGFYAPDVKASSLSGGWKKRLGLAQCLVQNPDLLLLDEPTNHMDWQSIAWLIKLLNGFRNSYLLISHDRHLLNAVTQKTIEIGPAFNNEHLAFDVPYYQFLEKRSDHFNELQQQLESLSNKARRELEWLRAGVKARTTKSRSRAKEAQNLFAQVDSLNEKVKSSQHNLKLSVDESDRKSKKLVELKKVSKSFDQKLFDQLDLKITHKQRLAILGNNGSGKTSLIKIIMQELQPDSGDVFLADSLQVVYFDQNVSLLDNESNIFSYLGEGSDYVVFKDKSMHVASYASKFLFDKDHFNLKISQLSGGERARLQLAKILLKPCDLFILDEPTNDLDIESIESLENLLSELGSALILISHDRDFITNICNSYLALNGDGTWGNFASLDQWLNKKENTQTETVTKSKPKKPKKKSMSYKDKKLLETIEGDIQKAEGQLEEVNLQITTETDHNKITELTKKLTEYEQQVSELYTKWQELEDLKNS